MRTNEEPARPPTSVVLLVVSDSKWEREAREEAQPELSKKGFPNVVQVASDLRLRDTRSTDR